MFPSFLMETGMQTENKESPVSAECESSGLCAHEGEYSEKQQPLQGGNQAGMKEQVIVSVVLYLGAHKWQQSRYNPTQSLPIVSAVCRSALWTEALVASTIQTRFALLPAAQGQIEQLNKVATCRLKSRFCLGRYYLYPLKLISPSQTLNLLDFECLL